jgi:4-hydroxybenzoate polyprenyltransferase
MLTVASATTFALYDPPIKEALLLLLSLFLTALYGNMIDMIWDIRIDRVCAPHRPLPVGMVSPLFVWHGALLGMATAWLLAAQTENKIAIIIVSAMLTTLFFLPSIACCNKLLSEIILSLVYSICVWVPPLVIEHAFCEAQSDCSFSSRLFRLNVWPLAVVSILFHLHRDIALDIADSKGDQAGGLGTVPALVGELGASYIVLFLLALCLFVVFITVYSWHTEWPARSRLVFLISTLVFVASCAMGFVVTMYKTQQQEQEEPENTDDTANIEQGSSDLNQPQTPVNGDSSGKVSWR